MYLSHSSNIFKPILNYERLGISYQPWDFFGRNDAKLKLQYFGHLMRRVDLLEKTLMLGGREKGTTEDEMAGWHQRLKGRESE